jgi:hypothetical protein
MTIRPVGAEFFMWRDGRTYMTKLIVAFRNFANVSKNQSVNAVWGNYGCLFADPYKIQDAVLGLWGYKFECYVMRVA